MGETPPYGMIGGIEETWHHRSPIRASILPDCGGRSVMSVPTAISELSAQNTPLKGQTDLRESSRIRATESHSRVSCGDWGEQPERKPVTRGAGAERQHNVSFR